MDSADLDEKRTEGEKLVLERMQSLLIAGGLKAGDKLPSERRFCEMFGATRGYVRKALQRLEYYGLVKTLPQKGTVVERIGGRAMSGIIQAIIEIEGTEDIASVMETRAVLERHAAKLAATRATEAQIASILEAHRAFSEAADAAGDTLDLDHLFHLAIARSCGNGVTLSLVGIMTPKIIAMNRDFDEHDPSRSLRTRIEHQAIVDAILARDENAAEAAMNAHMENSRLRRLKR